MLPLMASTTHSDHPQAGLEVLDIATDSGCEFRGDLLVPGHDLADFWGIVPDCHSVHLAERQQHQRPGAQSPVAEHHGSE